ncbi:MAG: formylglycine-generating enzyme family protein [Urechidicola sp.]|nr:formylglycine-generating enzyme family protein [Urechidicola sp.]
MRVVYLVIVLGLTISCQKKAVNEKPKTIEDDSSKVEKIETDQGNMVYFEGGTILIGSNNGPENEQPVFEVFIEPFYMDKNLVTVAEFRAFVIKTDYVTEAETFGDSGVFLFESANWTLLKGAFWEYPLGRNQSKAIDNHPVTHISWNDARTYAAWAGKRLPTEFEWEFAAKNGGDSKYSWGETVLIDGNYMANVWQGNSLSDAELLDGYLLTSPVGIFGETESGLTDMGGNVWQWCENVYESYPGSSAREPSDSKIRSTRGGSFMFDQALESSFTTTFRAKNSIDTSLFNTGFRCAK